MNLVASEDAEVVVDDVQLLDVHVVYEPHFPHRLGCPRLLEAAVPLARQRVGHVRVEVGQDARLVSVKPILSRGTYYSYS